MFPAERKTLVGYIRNKGSTVGQAELYGGNFLHFEPVRKEEGEFFNEINRKLLHIEKMKPITKMKEREREEKRMTHYLENRFPSFLGGGKEREKEKGEDSGQNDKDGEREAEEKPVSQLLA